MSRRTEVAFDILGEPSFFLVDSSWLGEWWEQ
jgi:hypothetical protein